MKFTDLNLHQDLLQGIEASNYVEATPIQEQVIPEILKGNDIIATAQTGTGKTAAFLLPLINNILTGSFAEHEIKAAIIVPTRELAIQISNHLEGLSYFTNISSLAVYGGGDGNSFIQEKTALSKGVDIVVCTPGKLIAHLNMGYCKVKHLKFLVLDEADRMLDMGFYDDIIRIINYLPKDRQTMLFSATMPFNIKKLADKILQSRVEINIALSRPPEKIRQKAFIVDEKQKQPAIFSLLAAGQFKSIIVFCSKKNLVKQLTQTLKSKKYEATEIHSDLSQSEREENLRKFVSKKYNILVATNVLSRGIDIDHIDLVINYDVPPDGEDYVHRIGRTARAENNGTAYTLVAKHEIRQLKNIERLIKQKIDIEDITKPAPRPEAKLP